MVGSALAREATGVLYTPAGPEIGVASSKTFTATMMAAYLLALWLGRRRGALGRGGPQARAGAARAAAADRADARAGAAAWPRWPASWRSYKDFLFLGRGIHYPIALEGALKLKELSYLHAEGYPAGEMKHGPIALIDEGMPVVALVPRDGTYERMMGNVEEVRARDGRVIAIGARGRPRAGRQGRLGDLRSRRRRTLSPILMAIPLQLLAYHVAVRLGRDVDQPRNLAKSVTVE